MIASVVVDVASNQVNRTFDYIVPSNISEIIDVGYRVRVPFGSRKVLGIVVELKEDTNISNLKEIYELLDLKPILTEEFIRLSSYMVKRYYTFYITALKTMIPQALRVKYFKKVHIIKDGVPDDIKNLFSNGYYIIKQNDSNIERLKKLESKGIIEIIDDFSDKAGLKTMKMVSLLDDNLSYKSPKGQMVIDYLTEIGEDVYKEDLTSDMGVSDSILKTLESHGNIKIYDSEVYRSPVVSEIDDKKVTLNEEQNNAYQRILSSFGKNKTFLLHGVCGSGKTEIYLNLIEKAIQDGKEAIMLVPEISLTPQMTQRFKARFKDVVAVLHSRLSIGEKYDEWRKIINGHAKIVVGARSAIFAPFKNLGLVIIDEEHEMSYIQDSNPKYDAIDIALWRTKYHNAPLVLGSATPRLDSYYKAKNGEYVLLELSKRANGRPFNPSKIIDMREELKNGNKKMFSEELLTAIKDTYNKNEQSILFLNRRGFSSFVMCRSCGDIIKCPNCDSSLTYHKSSARLKCHYCGFERDVPSTCPTCGSKYIKYIGLGTEKIVESIEKEIPGVRVLRVDIDTTREKNSYQKIFDSFRNHEADILVGTQIIAKGLDFPLVSLVGVLNADIGLKIPAYNASEITFDLIEQVSGRAGRDSTDASVYIQTYDPKNYAIRYAASHDYKGFYDEELRTRKILDNPPFSSRIEIKVSSSDKIKSHMEAIRIINWFKRSAIKSKVYGPAEDFKFKLKNLYNYVITIKDVENELLKELLQINEKYQSEKDVIISITRV